MKKSVSFLAIAFLLISFVRSQSAGSISGATPVCYNTSGSLYFSVPPSGGTTYAYQWYSSNSSTSGFQAISGATDPTLTTVNITTVKYFQCRVTIDGYPYWTTSFGIFANPVFSQGQISASQNLCYNQSADTLTFSTAPVGTVGAINYQWLESIDSISWLVIPGADTASYLPGVIADIKYLKCKVSNQCGTDSTNKVVIKASQELQAGEISGDQAICYKSKLDSIKGNFHPAGGVEPYTYQWQFSTDSLNWNDIVTGGESENFYPTKIVGKTFYRRIVSDNGCSSYSTDTVSILVRERLDDPLTNVRDQYCLKNFVKLVISNPLETNNWYSEDMTLLTSATTYEINSILEDMVFYIKSINEEGCKTDSVRLDLAIDQVKAEFSVVDNTVKAWETVNFNSSSTNASTYTWFFGDGNSSNVENPAHIYSLGGTYDVILAVGSTNLCFDSDTLISAVQVSPSSIHDNLMEIASIFPIPASEEITILLNEKNTCKLKIFDLAGELVEEYDLVNKENIIDISAFVQGNYLITLTDEEGNSGSQLITVE